MFRKREECHITTRWTCRPPRPLQEHAAHNWDLHNFADFRGFTFDPGLDELTMEWQVPPGQEDAWGSHGNNARGCRLRFSGLRFLRGNSRDRAYPLEESRTVSGISKATPEQGEYQLHYED